MASSRISSSRTQLYEGDYRYHNKDFYIQDNWKVTSRLTLDLGMRFTHHGPQYDIKQQASNFFADQWSRANAPLLYLPGCSTAGDTCPAANRVAIDPRTDQSLGAGSSFAIGTIVPNTGVFPTASFKPATGSRRKTTWKTRSSFGPRDRRGL